ncbi:MAG TPA: hypothetical protein ENJ16_06515 [Planctomycetaceae bacterium]|nr:hypothetical protein [Planctomycetaceae bacterium]
MRDLTPLLFLALSCPLIAADVLVLGLSANEERHIRTRASEIHISMGEACHVSLIVCRDLNDARIVTPYLRRFGVVLGAGELPRGTAGYQTEEWMADGEKLYRLRRTT